MRCHILTDRVAPFHTGGLENSILRIAKALRDMGHEICIYITEETGSEIPPFMEGIRYISLSGSIGELLEPIEDTYRRNNLYSRAVYHIMLNHLDGNDICREQDILFSFYISSYGFIQQRVADSLNLRHAAFVRGSDYSMDMHIPGKMSGIRYVCSNCSLIITTNCEQIRNLATVFNLSREKFRLCHNPVEGRTAGDGTAGNAPPVNDEILFISDVGYSWKKGTHILFKAFERLCHESEARCKLYLCGTTCNSEKAYWEREKARLNDQYPLRIVTDGYSNRFASLYSQASAYVFPSLAEGCPNALLKALSQNLTVITTRTGFMAELEDEPDGVYCVKPADSEELFRAMQKVAGTPLHGNYEKRINLIRNTFSEEKERETLKEIMKVL